MFDEVLFENCTVRPHYAGLVVDQFIRKRLEISENLNGSLRDDIKFLRQKIDRLNQEISS